MFKGLCLFFRVCLATLGKELGWKLASCFRVDKTPAKTWPCWAQDSSSRCYLKVKISSWHPFDTFLSWVDPYEQCHLSISATSTPDLQTSRFLQSRPSSNHWSPPCHSTMLVMCYPPALLLSQLPLNPLVDWLQTTTTSQLWSQRTLIPITHTPLQDRIHQIL